MGWRELIWGRQRWAAEKAESRSGSRLHVPECRTRSAGEEGPTQVAWRGWSGLGGWASERRVWQETDEEMENGGRQQLMKMEMMMTIERKKILTRQKPKRRWNARCTQRYWLLTPWGACLTLGARLGHGDLNYKAAIKYQVHSFPSLTCKIFSTKNSTLKPTIFSKFPP